MVAALRNEDDATGRNGAVRLVEFLAAVYTNVPLRLGTVEAYELAFADIAHEELIDAAIEHVRTQHAWPVVAELRAIVFRRRARAMRRSAEGLKLTGEPRERRPRLPHPVRPSAITRSGCSWARRLGDGGQVALLRLCGAGCAGTGRAGDLRGFTVADVEAGGELVGGSAGRSSRALIDLRLVDADGDDLVEIHDWREHQRYAIGSSARVRGARVAALVKQCLRTGMPRQWRSTSPTNPTRTSSQPSSVRTRSTQNVRTGVRAAVRNAVRAALRAAVRAQCGTSAERVRIRVPRIRLRPRPRPQRGEGDGRGPRRPARPLRGLPARPRPGGEPEPPTCAHCHRPADTGPSFQAKHLPLGLEEDLCPGHLTAWFEARNAADRQLALGEEPGADRTT